MPQCVGAAEPCRMTMNEIPETVCGRQAAMTCPRPELAILCVARMLSAADVRQSGPLSRSAVATPVAATLRRTIPPLVIRDIEDIRDQVIVEEDVGVVVRDGTRLSAKVFRPVTEPGSYPGHHDDDRLREGPGAGRISRRAIEHSRNSARLRLRHHRRERVDVVGSARPGHLGAPRLCGRLLGRPAWLLRLGRRPRA